jgi:nitrogen fixation NifU-like protein
LQFLRQYQPDKTDISTLIHVRPGQKQPAGVERYRLLRIIPWKGRRLCRSGQLLRKGILIMNSLDEFVNNLQAEIFEDAKQALGERGFQRWRNPKFNGRMENPDAYAIVTGECGDTMEIFLKFKNNRVSTASYFTNGCASSTVSGSFAAELTLGKNPDELVDITAEKVLNAIGRLPEEDQHCASLSARTVQEALTHYMSNLVKKTTRE